MRSVEYSIRHKIVSENTFTINEMLLRSIRNKIGFTIDYGIRHQARYAVATKVVSDLWGKQ